MHLVQVLLSIYVPVSIYSLSTCVHFPTFCRYAFDHFECSHCKPRRTTCPQRSRIIARIVSLYPMDIVTSQISPIPSLPLLLQEWNTPLQGPCLYSGISTFARMSCEIMTPRLRLLQCCQNPSIISRNY